MLGAGRNQMRVAAIGAAQGANVRVGLEDSLWIGAGSWPSPVPSRSSKVRQILEGIALTIASPDEAREMLGLKGGDKVGF